jgi:hypothetical protein
MGLGDNRRTPKMRRRVRQKKLLERIKRRRTQAAQERAGAKSKGTTKKKA